MKYSYWSCSKIADWIRGTPKISAGTAEEWNAWKKTAKAKKVRYWLAEEGLDFLQDLIYLPLKFINNIRHYFDNRWISKTHALTSNLKRGKYYEFDTRLLHALFDELVNFVEIEQAWHYVAWSKEEQSKYQIPWYYKIKLLGQWRCPEAGIAHLEWASKLKCDQDFTSKEDPKLAQSTPQALSAQETIILYQWWKEMRPNRLDPIIASGWSDYCEKRRQASGDDVSWMSSYDENAHAIMETCHKMEQAQDDEDTDMLIRLVKLRSYLWT